VIQIHRRSPISEEAAVMTGAKLPVIAITGLCDPHTRR
jgi:hypothetical protein